MTSSSALVSRDHDLSASPRLALLTSTEPRASPPAWLPSDWFTAIGLSALGVLLPVVVSITSGSFGIARADDWSYRRVAEHFFQSGHLNFMGWTSMTLVGQVAWSQPFLLIFGAHLWVLSLSTAVLGVIGIFCAYYLARQVLPQRLAAVAVFLVVTIPGFALNTSTFMTDVPAFSAEMACLALGVVALSRQGGQRWVFLIIVMAVGVFGFSIREFALTAPLAALLCAGAADRQHRARYLVAGFLELAVCVLIYRWTSHMPGNLSARLQRPTLFSTALTGKAYFTLALVLCPAVVLTAARRLRHPSKWSVAAGISVFGIGAYILLHFHGLLLGNYLDQQGVADQALLAGGRPILLPGPIWNLLTFLGFASGGLLASMVVEAAIQALPHWRAWLPERPTSLIWTFGVLMALGISVEGMTRGLFDRYLYPLALPVAIGLLYDTRPIWTREIQRRRRLRPAEVSLAVVSGFIVFLTAGVILLNSDTYDGARWRAGDVAVAHGIAANTVDAGFEWVGAHTRTNVNFADAVSAPANEMWYARIVPGFHECGVASGQHVSLPDLRLIRTEQYRLFGLFGPEEPIYVYVSSSSSCRKGLNLTAARLPRRRMQLRASG